MLQPKEGVTDGEESIALRYLRAQRHGFANRIQEISGWFELGRHEHVARLLKATAERLTAEATLTANLPEPIAGLLLGSIVLAEDRGVAVALDVLTPQACAMPDDWPGWRERFLDQWRGQLDALLRRQRQEVLQVRWEGRRYRLAIRPDAESPAPPAPAEGSLPPADRERNG